MNGGSGHKRVLNIEEGQHYFLEPDDELPYRSGQDMPVAYNPKFRSLETPALEANQMHGLPSHQQQVSQSEQVSASGERQLSMLPCPSEITSLVPENATSLWTYPITPTYTSLDIGDGSSSEHTTHARPISVAFEPPDDWILLFPVAQTSSLPVVGPTSNVADAGYSLSLTKFPCTECGQRNPCSSECSKHMLQHSKPLKCVVPECKRTEGFRTKNDLERHQKAVHRMYAERTSYQCVVENCRSGHKVWPRKDNFLLHVERMHKNENVADLGKRSRIIG